MPKARQDDYYTVQEAARFLDVSPSTVWRWIESEKLPAYRVGPKAIRIKKEELERIIRPVRARETSMDKERVPLNLPTQEELARRQVLAAKILALREQCSIAPLTTADLAHQVRREEKRSYGGSS